jgi:phosphatidylinositol alpha-mannosyltransferase
MPFNAPRIRRRTCSKRYYPGVLMRILLVSAFDFSYPGGVNAHVAELDRQFQAFGHYTRILAPRSDDEPENDDGHLFKLGMALPVPSNGSTARITLSPFFSNKVKTFLRRERFDIIHLHEPLAPTLPLMVLLHSHAINVGTFHAAGTTNLGYMTFKPILARFHAKLDVRITPSPAAMNGAAQYFPGPYEIIPNGINLERFGTHVSPLARYQDDCPTILFVGRFNESRKGLTYLIQALALVRPAFSTCRLLVVGPGNSKPFERLITQYGLDNVVFTGTVSRAELPAYYASADVFCAPSTGQESFGIVLLEAMASGKPVVATNIQGYNGVMRNGVEGLLIEPKDPAALAMALTQCLADADLRRRLGQAGRERAEEFACPVVASRILATYERAMAARDRAELPGPSVQTTPTNRN